MRLHPIALTLMTLTLAACGGGGSSDSSGSTTGTTPTAKNIVIVPSLGKLENEIITLRKLNDDIIATGIPGQTSFTVPAGINAIRIEVAGSPTATYFDEAVPDTIQPFPATAKMEAMAMVVADNQQIAVTPLTNIAVAYARETLHGVTEFSIVVGNATISNFFSINDILTPAAKIESITDFAGLKINTLISKEATSYALFLTALSKYSATKLNTTSTPMLKIMQEMTEDMKDGYLDKSPAASYVANNVPNGLKVALNDYAGVLTSHSVTLPIDLSNFMTGYTFRVNNISNDPNHPDTAPGGTGTGSTDPTVTQTVTYNIGPDALEAGWIGTLTGSDLDAKPCSLNVAADGTLSLYNGGVLVSQDKLNKGSEDMRIRNFDSGQLSSTFIIAKASTDVVNITAFGADASGKIRVAEFADDSTGKIKYVCQFK
ncbi:hypothetical protein EV700_1714 [Fluviicoccus keumensis]|uniref:Uncharacterized protein n=1 Tax=Fluviicoccus keumensis TaxID=1435465 RepID=A0A4Q7Z533_9GAMM|nr:hypothetical protein [Fluviicoccus keumensis]RZU44911.1 hypothetical protein EV700_1714 [Fluviicoccus keumensis]